MKKKKWVAIPPITAAAVAMAISPITAANSQNNSLFLPTKALASGLFSGGYGTETEPYLIASVQDVIAMENYPSAHYKLINDVDFKGATINSMFRTTPFFGTFDGNGFAIKNYKISENGKYVGLFGQAGSASGKATFKNLTISGADISELSYATSNQGYGALVGYAYDATFNNIKIVDTTVQAYKNAGGAIGETRSAGKVVVDNLSVLNVNVIGTRTSDSTTKLNHGGAIGEAPGAIISNVYVTGTVSDQHGAAVGGVIGSGLTVTLKDIVFDGHVSGYYNVGGIGGAITGISDVSVLVAYGTVKGTNPTKSKYIAGIVGNVENTSKFSKLFALNDEVSTGASVGTVTGEGEEATRISDSFYRSSAMRGGGNDETHTLVITPQEIRDYAFFYSKIDNFNDSWWIKDGVSGPRLLNSVSEQEQAEYRSFIDSKGYNNFEGGNGTVENPYLISTVEQWYSIESTGHAHYKLINDIDFKGNYARRQFKFPNYFTGTIDGNGFSLKNYKLIEGSSFIGLFGYVKNSTIKNIKIENVFATKSSKSGGRDVMGSLVGTSSGLTLENIRMDNVTINGGRSTGGLVGEFDYSTAKNIHATNIKVNNREIIYVGGQGPGDVGGLFGKMSPNATIKNIHFEGDVLFDYSGDGAFFGGIVGSGGVLENAIFKGNVRGPAGVGGAIGDANYTQTIPLKNVFTYGSVSGTKATSTRIGGVLGQSITTNSRGIFSYVDSVNVGSLTSLGKITGTNSVVANVKAYGAYYTTGPGHEANMTSKLSDAQMKDKSFYEEVGLDFETDWGIYDGETTPFLLFALSEKERNDYLEYINSEKLTPPLNFVVKALTHDKVSISFEPSKKATEYIIKRNGVEIARISDTTYEDSGLLSNTTYEYEVIAINESTQSTGVKASVTTLKANNAPSIKESIPSQLIYLGDISSTLDVSSYFTDQDGDLLSYEIYSTDDSILATVEGSVVTFKPLKVGTTQVTLKAKDPSGLFVEQTFNVTVKEHTLEAPQNLKALASSATKVQLSFDKVSNASEYIIKRDGVEIARIEGTTYEDNNLTPETAYEYEVIAVNEHSQSSSTKTNVKTLKEEPTEIDLSTNIGPKNLKAVAKNPTTVMLTYDSVEGASQYIIKRDGIELTRTVETAYEDQTVRHNTTYQYEVIAANNSSQSKGATSSVTTPIQYREITLEWPPSSEVVNYKIYRDNELIGETTNTKFTDTKAEDGKSYQYKIVGISEDDAEALSSGDFKVVVDGSDAKHSVELKENEKPTVPVVTNVHASAEGQIITITWDNFDEATRYRVQPFVLDPLTGEYVKDGFARSTTTNSLVLGTLKAGFTYKFEVVPATNRFLEESKGISNEITVEATTPETPVEDNTPSESLTVKVDGTTAHLSWEPMIDVSRYRVQLYVKDETGQYVKSGAARAIAETTISFTNLKVDTEYKFVIEPRIGFVYDADKALKGYTKIEDKTKPTEPEEDSNVLKNIQVEMNGKTASLSWDPLTVNGTEVTTYRIVRYVKDDETGNFKSDGLSRTVSSTSYSDTYKLVLDKTYRYEITPRVGNRYATELTTITAEYINE